jgi:glycosyltransferase involved in cell wall biosynthesis
MRIAVDAHAVGRKLTGNETYVRNLLREFASAAPDASFVAYVSDERAHGQLPARFETPAVARNPFIRLGFDLGRRLWLDQPDLVHVQYTAPLGCPVPVVVTVHDVSFLEKPEYFSRFRRTQLAITVRETVRRAAAIIAPSSFSRDRIAAAYNLRAEQIDVVHNGVDPEFRPMSRELARAVVADRHGIRAPYVLTVGDLQPRKNQTGLIRAFSALLQAAPHLPHHLVLVGKENWHGAEVRACASKSGFSDRIHFTGFVGDSELRHLYAGCDLFMFPSFYEGFGLPILEAMACGRAVACSDASAMPEVADSAGLLFDPASVESMRRAMADVLLDAELRQRLERLGLQRAARFSWQRAAEETLAVYRRVASAHWTEQSAAGVAAGARRR